MSITPVDAEKAILGVHRQYRDNLLNGKNLRNSPPEKK